MHAARRAPFCTCDISAQRKAYFKEVCGKFQNYGPMCQRNKCFCSCSLRITENAKYEIMSYQLPIQRRTFYTFSHLSRLVEKSQKAAVSKIFKTCKSLVITSVLFHSAGTVHWCNLFSLDLHPRFLPN